MFRLLFRQLHTIKMPESNLLFPVSKISLETKEDFWDDDVLKKHQMTVLAHSNALTPEISQIK